MTTKSKISHEPAGGCFQPASRHARLFKRATTSDGKLASFPEDVSVPQAIKRSFIVTSDPDKSRQKSRWTYVPDNREAEELVTRDDTTADNEDGVIPTGEDMSTAGLPGRLRALGASTPADLQSLSPSAFIASAGAPLLVWVRHTIGRRHDRS